MDARGFKFAELLTKAIYRIKQLEEKKISAIQDEIGIALGKSGGASVEHWRKGYFPTKWSELEVLARILVSRGKVDRDWLEQFLELGQHPNLEKVVIELFPKESFFEEEIPAVDFNLPTDELPEPGNLPPGSQMPLSRNRFFVGRKLDLLHLARHFQQGHMAAVGQSNIAAAIGLGGVGKTQLASEFVHLYGQFFHGGVYWLSFEDAEAVPSKIAACGGVSGMNLSPIFWELPLEEQVKLVRKAWQSPIPRLLVFDNCEDEELLAEWLPTSGGCRILVTTRRGDWDPILGVQTISLGALYRHESIDLLASLSKANDRDALDKIAAELGDLPLALHMAGRYLYLRRRSITPANYLAELQDPKLLDHESLQQSTDSSRLSPTGHVQHVARTFALSYDQLDLKKETDELAHALLVRVAHFAPGEPIWYQLLIKTVEPIVGYEQLEIKADQGFSRLIDLGLIEYEEKDDIFRMHRLVAAFVRQFAEDAVQETLASVESIVFEETARINKAGYPVPLLSWNLHLRAVTESAVDRRSGRSAWLLNSVGEHFRQMGDYQGASEYFRKALDIWLETAGPKHEHTAEGYLNVGKILRDLGQLDHAESFLKKALDLRLEILGDQHPQTAEAYNEYGRLLFIQQDFDGAQSYLQQAVDVSMAAVGKFHASTADYLNNLGMIVCSAGECEKSLLFLQNALEIRQKIFGKNNPRTALSLNNIGHALSLMNRFNESKAYHQEAYGIRKDILGEYHLDTAESLNNLGYLYVNLDETIKALEVLSFARKICEVVFSGPHPNLVVTLTNIGHAEYKLGRVNNSESTLNQALDMGLELFSNEHPLNKRIIKRMKEFNFKV
ncbi:MAG: tetratricopeptide repeat protein [Chloroflexota bacterium]